MHFSIEIHLDISPSRINYNTANSMVCQRILFLRTNTIFTLYNFFLRTYTVYSHSIQFFRISSLVNLFVAERIDSGLVLSKEAFDTSLNKIMISMNLTYTVIKDIHFFVPQPCFVLNSNGQVTKFQVACLTLFCICSGIDGALGKELRPSAEGHHENKKR